MSFCVMTKYRSFFRKTDQEKIMHNMRQETRTSMVIMKTGKKDITRRKMFNEQTELYDVLFFSYIFTGKMPKLKQNESLSIQQQYSRTKKNLNVKNNYYFQNACTHASKYFNYSFGWILIFHFHSADLLDIAICTSPKFSRICLIPPNSSIFTLSRSTLNAA